MTTVKFGASAILTTLVMAGVFAVSGTASAQSYATPSCNIYANPSTVNYTGVSYTPVIINWNSSNATSANLTNVGSVSTSGSQTFYPSNTTTYNLVVYNAQGQSANCQTTVTVNNSSSSDEPSCWITLAPQYSYNNQQALLSWGSTDASSAEISPNIGSVSTSGSRTVYGDNYVIYTMTVENSDDEDATCQTSQYNQPSYPPYQYGNLSCSITANPTNITNGITSYLSWTSYGATSAWLSDGIGSVGLNGSLTVRPEGSRNYTLTVTDNQGRTQTCNAYVTVSGGYPPYVNLSQIPYTGFDFGPLGNALYWLALLSFSVGAGYLIVYYMPLFSFGGARTSRNVMTSSYDVAPVSYGMEIPTIFQREREVIVTSAPENLPVFSTNETSSTDALNVLASKEGGAPKIVITRN